MLEPCIVRNGQHARGRAEAHSSVSELRTAPPGLTMNQDDPCIQRDEEHQEERPDLLDASEEPQSTPAERLGFEPFQYTERS